MLHVTGTTTKALMFVTHTLHGVFVTILSAVLLAAVSSSSVVAKEDDAKDPKSVQEVMHVA